MLRLLSLIVRITGARHVVEIGTANGYSTVWLADAVGDTGGHVVSIDTATNGDARTNLIRADGVQPGLAKRVELRQEDGGAYLVRLADGSVDLSGQNRCGPPLMPSPRWRPRTHVGTDETTYRGTR